MGVLRWLAEQQAPQVDFSGGEPFVRRDIRDLMYYARRCNITLNACTNGCIADEKDLELLANMRRVTITFYGLEKFHDSITRVRGSYRKAIRTVKMLKGSKTRLRANVVTLAEALCDLPALADQLQEAGVDEIKFSMVFPVGRAMSLTSQLVTKRENEKLAQAMLTSDHLQVSVTVQVFGHDSFVCQIPEKGGLFLTHDGCIYPCPLFRHVNSEIGRITATRPVYDALEQMDWGKALACIARAGENRCPAIDMGLFEDVPGVIVHQGCPPLVESK
jgi:MoaA/NifB/PqqE/SkfB family radical SAM enzyme